MLIGKPGLFDIDDDSHTFQSCHVQNIVYTYCIEMSKNA
jgi:hypothetical protein